MTLVHHLLVTGLVIPHVTSPLLCGSSSRALLTCAVSLSLAEQIAIIAAHPTIPFAEYMAPYSFIYKWRTAGQSRSRESMRRSYWLIADSLEIDHGSNGPYCSKTRRRERPDLHRHHETRAVVLLSKTQGK